MFVDDITNENACSPELDHIWTQIISDSMSQHVDVNSYRLPKIPNMRIHIKHEPWCKYEMGWIY